MEPRKHILCVGTTPAVQRVMAFQSLSLDRVNRASRTIDGVAGKSVNVAKILKTLGEHPVAVGFAGGDRGAQIIETLHHRGIETDFVRTRSRTRECITVIDEQAGTHTELVEESPAITPEEYQQLEAVVKKRLLGARAIVLSGTLAPGVPQDFYARCVTWARQAGALTIVDAQGPALSLALAVGPAVVKPNKSELASTLARPIDTRADLLAAMQQILAAGTGAIVVTAGADPTWARDGTNLWRISNPRVKALNPIGSGDAFTAGMTAALVRGQNFGIACSQGAAAGTANALTWMAGEIDVNEFNKLLPVCSAETVAV